MVQRVLLHLLRRACVAEMDRTPAESTQQPLEGGSTKTPHRRLLSKQTVLDKRGRRDATTGTEEGNASVTEPCDKPSGCTQSW